MNSSEDSPFPDNYKSTFQVCRFLSIQQQDDEDIEQVLASQELHGLDSILN